MAGEEPLHIGASFEMSRVQDSIDIGSKRTACPAVRRARQL